LIQSLCKEEKGPVLQEKPQKERRKRKAKAAD